MNVKLSELELRVICLLDDSLTMGELAERAAVTRSYISRAVATLMDKGFVEISKSGITKKRLFNLFWSVEQHDANPANSGTI